MVTGIPSGMASVPVINQSLEGNRKQQLFGGNTKDIQLGFGAAFGYSYRNIYDLYASYKRDGSSLLPLIKDGILPGLPDLDGDSKSMNF